MAEYTFKCTKCRNRYTLSMGMNEPKPKSCEECEGALVRDYSCINFDSTAEMRDPNSPRFWKNGKTTEQLADVIEKNVNPY